MTKTRVSACVRAWAATRAEEGSAARRPASRKGDFAVMEAARMVW
eukprot:CAMPEP_0198237130 /NCGR_PEP_ID=MMETSP1446-20131203/2976_1 /TAXON_ID=1461542 ORGANISM="Unidentified sp, Strain CCMP2111" /NCGR_SAMPLE_ID=MMETSP1446 /ASSEMBLY_ACC=CAM_ASM_001112 /LENGTH=44 /DNA_ID= /DNA_START= /DNA_END= /DNA_ORIENTATION=